MCKHVIGRVDLGTVIERRRGGSQPDLRKVVNAPVLAWMGPECMGNRAHPPLFLSRRCCLDNGHIPRGAAEIMKSEKRARCLEE